MKGTNETTIKYLDEKTELKRFFKELETRRYLAKTKYAISTSIRNEAFFKIMYFCALRVSETTHLEVDDFNPLNKEIYCRRLKGSLNNTLRIVDDDILRALKRHISYNKPNKYLFENKKGEPLSRKTFDAIIRSVCASANIRDKDKWHCHTLRHSRAVVLGESGLDLKEIQYWMGHKEISNTQIYYQFTSRQHDALYRKLTKRKYLLFRR